MSNSSKLKSFDNLIHLPPFLLDYLIMFLHPKDIYLSLNSTCSFLYKFISNSNYLKLHVSMNSFGLSYENLKSITGLNDSVLNEFFFKKLQTFPFDQHDIPFYGFYSDGGVDSNSPEYWVDTLFTKGEWSICTRAGQNFHIKGVLSEKFEKVIKGVNLFHEINRDFKRNFFCDLQNPEIHQNDDFFSKFSANFLMDTLKKELETFKKLKISSDNCDSLSSDEEFQPKNKSRVRRAIKKTNAETKKGRKKKETFTRLDAIFDGFNKKDNNPSYRKLTKYELLENLSLSMETLKKTEIKWKKVKESNDYEIYDDNFTVSSHKYAIIKGFEISRRGVFTCPMKTCMVFISDFDVDIKKIEIFNLFKEAKTIQEIKMLYENIGNDLPSIYHTNCPELKSKAIIETKAKACECSIARFIIFNNTFKKLSKEVKPIAWLQFTNPNLKELKVKLDEYRLFGGRYVILKLIDCENKMAEFGDLNEESNIDINYVNFFGDVIELKKTILI